jgi:phosphoribosylformylglycinamidine synthase
MKSDQRSPLEPSVDTHPQRPGNAPGAGASAPAWRVEVFRADRWEDPRGAQALAAAKELGLTGFERVRFGRGYLLNGRLSRPAVERLARELLCDPVVDELRLYAPGQQPESPRGAQRLLAAPLPGVMDPVAQSVAQLLPRLGLSLPTGEAEVGTFRIFEVFGAVTPAALGELARRSLANETIERISIGQESLPFGLPGGSGRRGRVTVPLCALDDAGLGELSKRGQLSLNLVEMRAVQAHFAGLGREPSAAELETIAQTWSEHCKHKTLTGVVDFETLLPDGQVRVERIDNLLKATIVAATERLNRDYCLSVFKDNAGIVAFEGDWAVCFKVETHNHPSAIDPYGGAGTGIGGVVRDILGAGLGAKPIANTNAFFVGPPDLPEQAVPKGSLHPRRVLRGVVAGVRDYGNCMGIPTVNGGLWFHPGYTANPLVYAGTVGLLPRRMVEKEVRPGDKIVSMGGRTGRDGIHGATFSSLELSEHSETESSHAVQIGNPITEKGVLDCLLAARDRGLYRGVTDCGAGGYSSAVGEMGEHGGARVQLDQVPLKYPGLASHEIWISEAQERMVLAVPPEKLSELLALCAAEDVEANVIGEFTDTGRLEIFDGPELIGELDMRFLHKGTPRPIRRARFDAPRLVDPGVPRADQPARRLLELLGSPNLCSRQWIVRQYDHEVQGNSAIKSLVGVNADGPGNAAVIQPLPGSRRGLTIACGANPAYGSSDPYAMALCAIDEALRNAVAVGGDPTQASILDNFSWGNCDKPDRLGALVLAARGCYDGALAYGTPFISGKDSLNNEYRVGGETLAIPPTLLISALAPVPDIARAQTMDLKRAGNRLYLVGQTRGIRRLGLFRAPGPGRWTRPPPGSRAGAADPQGGFRSHFPRPGGGLPRPLGGRTRPRRGGDGLRRGPRPGARTGQRARAAPGRPSAELDRRGHLRAIRGILHALPAGSRPRKPARIRSALRGSAAQRRGPRAARARLARALPHRQQLAGATHRAAARRPPQRLCRLNWAPAGQRPCPSALTPSRPRGGRSLAIACA